MDKMTLLNEIMLRGAGELDLIPTLMNFFMCLLMGFVLRDFYIRRSFSLTGKQHIGSILPILSAVVFLVIVVVKSSLALSLGLVGAFSAVFVNQPLTERTLTRERRNHRINLGTGLLIRTTDDIGAN